MTEPKRKRASTAVFLVLSLLMTSSLSYFLQSPQSTVQLVNMKQNTVSSYVNNRALDILSRVEGIESMKILPYDFSTPPNKPNENNYSKTPDGRDYYCDGTIEVTCWRENISKLPTGISPVYFADVKIKHASQFRRQWANGDYNAKGYQYPSNMFAASNGVVGMSADFYKHRKYGVIIQYGNVICDKRTYGALDVLTVDYNGDFHIWNDQELSDYIGQNGAEDIMLSFTFGPVIVQNGKAVEVSLYEHQRLGELFQYVGRSAIGQIGKLHYLLCTVSNPGMNCTSLSEIMEEKGCETAYNLDGGQTGTLLFHGEVYNEIAYKGVERAMSDIIYFASVE